MVESPYPVLHDPAVLAPEATHYVQKLLAGLAE